MGKTKMQIITEAITAKGLEIESIQWEPISKGFEMCGPNGGWTIFIDQDKTPLRGTTNPIVGYNTGEVLDRINDAYKGYDYCPNCNIGISKAEERMAFCYNCKTSFKEDAEA